MRRTRPGVGGTTGRPSVRPARYSRSLTASNGSPSPMYRSSSAGAASLMRRPAAVEHRTQIGQDLRAVGAEAAFVEAFSEDVELLGFVATERNAAGRAGDQRLAAAAGPADHDFSAGQWRPLARLVRVVVAHGDAELVAVHLERDVQVALVEEAQAGDAVHPVLHQPCLLVAGDVEILRRHAVVAGDDEQRLFEEAARIQ